MSMNKKLLIHVALLGLVALAPCALAQNLSRTVEGFHDQGSYLEITTNDGQYRVKPYSEQMIETTFIPNGESVNPDSHAVVLLPAQVSTRLTESAIGIHYATAGMVVNITKVPFQISYAYKGKHLISEKNGYSKTAAAEILDFNLDATEALYGAGARALGMNRRGNRLPLYNKAHYGYEERSSQMNFAIPLVFSSKMYGIHFDNAPIGFLDFDSKKENVLAYETISGRKTYQIIAGDSWQDIVASYTSLTGRQPLPPRWVFGNFSSRFGYHTQAEASTVLDQFAAEKIPVDAIIFDLYWFGKDIKGTMGNLTFDKDNFPDPKGMMADFSKKGIKTILITEPFILTTSGKWNEAVEKNILATDKEGKPFVYDFYFGNTGLIDIFNPAAKAWFWSIYKDLNKAGVAGWWGDLGEPEVHPSDLQHQTGSADQVHNIYGHNWARMIAEGYQKDFPEQRPFILMRSGYSGSQRFGMIPWSGDVNRTWGGLRPQPEIALQMGLQGLAYMHSDLGGFAGANLDDELYARWLQYGVFQPVFRPHAQEEVAAEPVLRERKTKLLAKAAIELRYQMLPYNYTLAFDNNQTGLPLMRPLFYEEPQNEKLFGVADTYLWGHEFLVSPVLQKGQTAVPVYFPVTNNWFDFYSGQRYHGGSTQAVTATESHIPVFVRGGAFVPMIKTIQNTSLYSVKNFDLHYYYDASVSRSVGKLYDDNGATPNAFEKGDYALLHFSGKVKKRAFTIELRAEDGARFTALDRTVTLIVHHIKVKPRQVLLQDKAIDFCWNNKAATLTIVVPWKKKTTVNLIVSLSESLSE